MVLAAAAAALSGNYFRSTCIVLFVPTANCAVTGLIGVHLLESRVCKFSMNEEQLFEELYVWYYP